MDPERPALRIVQPGEVHLAPPSVERPAQVTLLPVKEQATFIERDAPAALL